MTFLDGLIHPSERPLVEAALAQMDAAKMAQLVEAVQEAQRRGAQRMFYRTFPDQDSADRTEQGSPLFHSRHGYPKQLEFFGAGAAYRERCLMAANRVGKTVAGAYETTAHLTGLYPNWWPGRRFARPVHVWAAGKNNETTRDIVQVALLGGVDGSKSTKRPAGTGMIPGDLIGEWSWRQGVADLIDTIKVRHATGGWSTLGLKSYEQGRGSFEGTARHAIWFDEEPPLSVYSEALIRTATTDGLVYTTFTPLGGMSDVVLQFVQPNNEEREP